MDLITKIRIGFSIIMFFGIPFYLYYRDSMRYSVALIGYLVCAGIWTTYMISEHWPKKAGWIALFIGASCNQIAMWANGGKMPVASTFLPHGVWRPMVDSDKLKFLCDIYWGTTSIGDLICVGGFALLMIFWLIG